MAARRGINRVCADLIVEELIRSGVDCFCLSSGFRSAPLAMAVVGHPKARYVMHFDERGSAYFALGYGRSTGRPAAWITTSGTAAANGLPAVVEAALDGVPMLLLTADRPPELRETGANQTIDQVGLFARYPRWEFDVPPPGKDARPEALLTAVDQAVYRARRSPMGPVHLNCMFREPLADEEPESVPQGFGAAVGEWKESSTPHTTYVPVERRISRQSARAVWNELCAARRGLVVAGRLSSKEEGDAVLGLGRSLRWPVVADIASQARFVADSEVLIETFDQVLGSDRFRSRYAPDAVVHVGGRCVSKRLAQWLAATRPSPYVLVRDSPDRLDPNHQVTHRIEAAAVPFCEALSDEAPPARDTAYLKAWRDASAAAGAAIEVHLSAALELSEPFIARAVTRHLPAGHALTFGSSMPVRDADMFAANAGSGPLVATNRGASGIDGTIATAAGVAYGAGGPATLVLGDLALLHDLNSLHLAARLPVVVIVLNNNGGGIFHFLSVAEPEKYFERCFGTPHGLTFDAAAAQFSLTYIRPESPRAFVEAYLRACRSGSAALIEVVTDRRQNLAIHRRLLSLAAAAVDRQLPEGP